MTAKTNLSQLFSLLADHFGPQHWWPGDTPFEVMVGAVLTQNTNWQNVAKAIANLQRAGVLSLEAMRALPPRKLAGLIRPAGYYNLKQSRLRNLLDMIAREHGGSLESLFAQPLAKARGDLLAVKGVGPETADSILLYAGGLPIFVIDAYTFRILERHGLGPKSLDYHGLQGVFMSQLDCDGARYNEFHALLVRLAKEYCRKGQPLCEACPAQGWSLWR